MLSTGLNTANLESAMQVSSPTARRITRPSSSLLNQLIWKKMTCGKKIRLDSMVQNNLVGMDLFGCWKDNQLSELISLNQNNFVLTPGIQQFRFTIQYKELKEKWLKTFYQRLLKIFYMELKIALQRVEKQLFTVPKSEFLRTRQFRVASEPLWASTRVKLSLRKIS